MKDIILIFIEGKLPKYKKDRGKDCWYTYKDEICFWDGKYLKCEHYHDRGKCIECGGSQLCKHNKQKYRCVECEGVSICKHKKRRNQCVECGGVSICKHKREKSRCKYCGGSQICKHKRVLKNCVDCGGSQICKHKRQRNKCKDCNGSGICKHKRERNSCIICGGSKICVHKKDRNTCVYCCKNRKNFCKLCDSVYIKGCSYYPFCFHCHCLSYPEEIIPRRYKLKQNYIYNFIKKIHNNFEYDKAISGGLSNKPPDFLFDKLTHSVIIEIDEDQHTNYLYENERTMSIFNDLGCRPLVMIRFNPDKYKCIRGNVNGCFIFDEKNNIITDNKEFENRINSLLENLQYNIDNTPTKEITEIKLFFDNY